MTEGAFLITEDKMKDLDDLLYFLKDLLPWYGENTHALRANISRLEKIVYGSEQIDD